MRIQLSEFELPGNPGVDGDVVYTSIDFDINSGNDPDNSESSVYYVSGYRPADGVGVVIHGTQRGGTGRHQWRFPHLIHAPSSEEHGITVTSTEFHGVESLEGPYVRLVGSVKTEEKPGINQGFLYEGPCDGSGDWYQIEVPESDETIVKASRKDILVCSSEDNSDSVHIYSLSDHSWSELHTGYAVPWSVEEVIPAGEIYIIRLVHEDGKQSNVTYSHK